MWSSPSEVRRVLNLASDDQSITDDEINDFISDASNILIAEVGGKEQDVFAIAQPKYRTFRLFLQPVLEVDKVWINRNYDNYELDTSQYTFDQTQGTITINDDVNLLLGYKVYVWYVPQIYKTLETYLTAGLILDRLQIDVPNGNSQVVIQNIQKRIDDMITIIKSKPSIAFYSDHAEYPDIW